MSVWGRAVEKLAPDFLDFDWIPMDGMPFYNADLEDARPVPVQRFVSEIASADALCFVTPEYNRSIPGVLKNAIDWGSKPPEQNVWCDKVVAMTGTFPGNTGTAVAQQHLRQILSILGCHVVPGEVYLSFKPSDLIDEDGTVTDGGTRDFIAGFGQRFAKLIEHMADYDA